MSKRSVFFASGNLLIMFGVLLAGILVVVRVSFAINGRLNSFTMGSPAGEVEDISCPWSQNAGNPFEVEATFSNPSADSLTFETVFLTYNAGSEGESQMPSPEDLMPHCEQSLTLAPGESQTLECAVSDQGINVPVAMVVEARGLLPANNPSGVDLSRSVRGVCVVRVRGWPIMRWIEPLIVAGLIGGGVVLWRSGRRLLRAQLSEPSELMNNETI